MPSVSIEVDTYKRMFERLCHFYKQFDPDNGVDYLLDEFEELIIPEWVCIHCGHVDIVIEANEPCPRCGRLNTDSVS